MQDDDGCRITLDEVCRLVANTRLDSWKSIANYLGRSLRTVQRWHAEYEMPVYHFGSAKGSVFSYTGELDQWLQKGKKRLEGLANGEHPLFDAKKKQSSVLCARADAMWKIRSERNLASITAFYREAVEEDPSNAAAMLGLSRSLIASALHDLVDGYVAYPKALEALRRVSEMGIDGSEIADVAGWLQMVYERRWRAAGETFDGVLRSHSDDSYALAGRALLYVADADLPNAFRCAWESWIRNPLTSSLGYLPAWIEHLSGHSAEALELIDGMRAIGDFNGTDAAVEALALAQTLPNAPGLERIKKIAEAFPTASILQGVLGYSYGICGHPGKTWAILGTQAHGKEGKNGIPSYRQALLLLGLDEKIEACAYLERSFMEGSLWSLGFRVDPLLKPLRGLPRFEALLQRIGSQTAGTLSTKKTRSA